VGVGGGGRGDGKRRGVSGNKNIEKGYEGDGGEGEERVRGGSGKREEKRREGKGRRRGKENGGGR